MSGMTREQAIAALTGPGAPYEIEHIEARGRRIRAFKAAPTSLRALYEETVSDAPFLVYGDERLSFAQAWAEAAKVGHALVHRLGVEPGDRVAISMRNYPEWVIAFKAITAVGAIAVAMNALWQHEEMGFALHDSGARVLFADQERLDRLARLVQPCAAAVVSVRAAQHPVPAMTLEDLTRGLGEVAMPATDIAPDDDATLFYTSGSTGRPKGVASTHRNILSALLSWEVDRGIAELMAPARPPPPEQQPATLLAVPLFHVTGSHAVYLQCYRMQRRLVSMYRWDAQQGAQLIERERISSFIAPAAMTGDLERLARAGRHDLGSLLSVGGGGAPRAPEQVHKIRQSFANAMPGTGWGMTETNSIGTTIGGEDYLARPASSGRCSVVLDLRIVDERGEEVPDGSAGELQVRGASVFSGYWQRPEANAESFVGDWFRTGDVAMRDAEGFIYIVDRIKDVIIRGGENIGCGQVEAVLLAHPDVHEAAVYGVPDARLGEEVAATVHGPGPLDPEALQAFLARHLARFEVPRTILVSATPLPRTPSGKIHKREIRAAALRALSSREG